MTRGRRFRGSAETSSTGSALGGTASTGRPRRGEDTRWFPFADDSASPTLGHAGDDGRDGGRHRHVGWVNGTGPPRRARAGRPPYAPPADALARGRYGSAAPAVRSTLSPRARTG